MKKLFTILTSLLLTLTSYTQDWTPFPIGQSSYYMHGPDANATVEFTISDSQTVSQGKTTQYFLMKPPIPNDCYFGNENEFNQNHTRSPLILDSVVIQNDSTFLHQGNYSLLVKSHSLLNEQWTTHGVTFTCTDLKQENVFGIQDSVKTFSGNFSDGTLFEWKLSKQFGLIQYSRLFKFFNQLNQDKQYKLIGLENITHSIGYNHPKFEDFFQLQPGDQIFWKYEDRPDDINTPDNLSYQVHNIISSNVTSTFAEYEVLAHYLNENSVHTHSDTISVTYWADQYKHLLSIPGAWFGIDNLTYFSPYPAVAYTSPLKINIENGDTTTSISYFTNDHFIDTSNCNFGYIMDGSTEYKFKTTIGMVNYSLANFGFRSEEVIGSIINGKKTGRTYLVSTNEISKTKDSFISKPCKKHDLLRYRSVTKLYLRNLQSKRKFDSNFSFEFKSGNGRSII